MSLKTIYRDLSCNDLGLEHVGNQILLTGWVSKIRDLGGVTFIDLRDRFGKTQIVIDPEIIELVSISKQLKPEWVIQVTGIVQIRPQENINKLLNTGKVEVLANKINVLNQSSPLPFSVESSDDFSEDLRLKYRFLDLRRDVLQKKLLFRSQVAHEVRNYFNQQQFVEIETPILMKSTPEGARDFLVPSRLNPGKFYALPQSPQTYKQILMVSGFDRYFQIVKCFRDEDLRADRQPEFTQIDVEMSFVDQKDIQLVAEELVKHVFKSTLNVDLITPFPKMDYKAAMETYGSDKPDLRNPLKIKKIIFENKTGFKLFDDAIDNDLSIVGIKLGITNPLSRKQLDTFIEKYKSLGLPTIIHCKVKDGKLDSSITKFLTSESIETILENYQLSEGESVLLTFGNGDKFLTQFGNLRLELGKLFNMNVESEYEFLWVNNFPLLEWDEDEKRYIAMHHPFTSPLDEDIDKFDHNPADIKAKAYDLVLNGNEIAGGSIRIYKAELQSKMFKALGINENEANEKFGFLLDAFKYGAPPHGGIAFGLDRMIMLMTNSSSIREVIAFPKNSNGQSLMDNSPSEVSNNQLKEIYIQTVQKLK